MTTEEDKKLQLALRRVQGQVGGIGKMVSENGSCEAVLTQISAAMSALKTVGRQLLADEAEVCAKTETGRQKYAKLLKRFF